MKKKQKGKEIIFGITLFSLIAIVLALSYLLFVISPNDFQVADRSKEMKELENKYHDEILSWIRVQGTNIDMPVIYRKKDTDVSRADYDFAWSYPKTDTLTNRAIFTSHNILNVSSNPLTESEDFRRFDALPAFLYSDFAKENQFIQYSVGGKDYVYRIFSVSMVKEASVDYDHDEYSKKELKEYIEDSLNDSYYKYDTKVDENDSILTLITCTRFFGATDDYSLKIDARKVRNNEGVKAVPITVKSNYHVIDETMKEGERDEKA